MDARDLLRYQVLKIKRKRIKLVKKHKQNGSEEEDQKTHQSKRVESLSGVSPLVGILKQIPSYLYDI